MVYLQIFIVVCGFCLEKNIDEVVRFLEKSSRVIFKWFNDNQFQPNTSKCHVVLSTDEHVQVKIGAAQMEKWLERKVTRCDNLCKSKLSETLNKFMLKQEQS